MRRLQEEQKRVRARAYALADEVHHYRSGGRSPERTCLCTKFPVTGNWTGRIREAAGEVAPIITLWRDAHTLYQISRSSLIRNSEISVRRSHWWRAESLAQIFNRFALASNVQERALAVGAFLQYLTAREDFVA
jgi:hypothetical protein